MRYTRLRFRGKTGRVLYRGEDRQGNSKREPKNRSKVVRECGSAVLPVQVSARREECVEGEMINKQAIVSKMQSFLDLWERTKDIQYYYEYQKYFKQLKDEINK